MVCTIVSDGKEILSECKNKREQPYPEIKERLREIIWTLYCKGYKAFFVNCEYGIPLWSAEIICALKIYNDIELHVVMPYEEQSAKWHDGVRERYFNVHAQADSVTMIDTQYRDGCYREADEMMIAESDLTAVFGKKENALCAEECAKKKNIKIMYF